VPDDSSIKIIGDYRVIEEISRGVMGVVHKTIRNGKYYAIKILRNNDLVNTVRFRREAASIARLKNESLVSFIDFNENGGNPYLVMEYLDGQTLSSLVEKGPLSEEFVLKIGRAISAAVSEIHRYKMIHRDIKAANIMVTSTNHVKLLDLGLAGDASDIATENQSDVVGTVLYSSPEQLRILRRPVDARSDLYALGVTLYQCLTGSYPFFADDVAEIIKMHASNVAPDVREKAKNTSPILAAIVTKLLLKDPDDRYQTAQGLLYDFEHFVDLEKIYDQEGKIQLGTRDAAGLVGEQALAGRSVEFGILKSLWQESQGGTPVGVIVEGEGGSGKSRLTQELLREIEVDPSSVVIRGKCQNLGVVGPFAILKEAYDSLLARIQSLPEQEKQIWIKMIKQAAGDGAHSISSLSKGFKEILGGDEENSEHSEVDQETFLTHLVHFVTGLAKSKNGTVLVIDDIQWIDHSTKAFMTRLTEELKYSKNTKLMLLMTSRNDGSSMPTLNQFKEAIAGNEVFRDSIALGPLDFDAVKEIVDAQIGRASLERGAIQKIRTIAHGNPFVVTEIIRSVLSSGELRYCDGGWQLKAEALAGLSLSSDVFQLVLKRMELLHPDVKSVLQIASVLGNTFDLDAIVEIHEVEEQNVLNAIQAAMENDLVLALERGKFRFIHDRIQETLFSNLDKERTKDLHDKAAEFLYNKSDDKPWYDIARHYASGHVGQNLTRAIEANLNAGAMSLRNFAYHQAFDFLRFAYVSSKHRLAEEPKLFSIAKDLALAALESGHVKEAHEAVDFAFPLARSRIDTLDLFFLKIRIYASAGKINEGWATFRKFSDFTGRPIPRYSFGKLLEINWRLLCVGLKLITGFKFGSCPVGSARRKELESICNTYYTTSFHVNRFRGDILDFTLVNLRGIEIAFPLGKSDQLARAFINAAILVAPFKLERLFQFLVGRAMEMLDESSKGPAMAYLKMIEFLGYIFVDNPKWKDMFEEVMRETPKYLGSFEVLMTWMMYTKQCVFKGQYNTALDFLEPRVAALPRLGHLMFAIGIYAHLAEVHAALGNVEASVKFKKIAAQLIEARQMKDMKQTAFEYLLMQIYSCHEEAEYGPSTDLMIDFFQRLHYLDHWSKHTLVLTSYIRLAQLERAINYEEIRRARKMFKRSLRSVYFTSYTSAYRAHWFVAKAGYLRWQGKYRQGLKMAERGLALGREGECAPAMYYASREIARIRQMMKDPLLVKRDAFLPYKIAIDLRWTSRARSIEREFDWNAGTMIPGAADSGVRLGSSHSRTLHASGRDSSIHGNTLHASRHGSSFADDTVRSSASAGNTISSRSAYTKSDRAINAMTRASLAAATSMDPIVQARNVLSELISLFGAERAFLFLDKSALSAELLKGEQPPVQKEG